MRDLYAVFLTALSMFLGMGLYSIVATYVVTRKKFLLWAFKKGAQWAQEEEKIIEEMLEK